METIVQYGPVAGGFVCGPESTVEWVGTVERVWTAYYGAIGDARKTCGGEGCREEYDLAKAGIPGLSGGSPGVFGESADGMAGSVGEGDNGNNMESRKSNCGGTGDGCDSTSVGRFSDFHGKGNAWRNVRTKTGVDDGRRCLDDKNNGTSVGSRVVKPKHAGDNWQRNRDARAKKKANKKARQQAVVEVERESSGFWKSCPEEVRQQLIRSKAEMHIAENLRRAREDRKKVERMDSPEGYVVEALKMLRLASEIKKVDNDNKVAGWATVVANECAETIAKSVPSTAKSFEDFVASQGGISSRSSAPDVPLESKPEVVEKIVEVPVEKVVVKEKIVKVEVPVVKYVDKVKYVQIPPEGGRPKPSKDLSFGVTFKNPIERAVVAMGMIDDRQLLDARKNLGRELGYADFVGAEGKKKYKLTKNHVVQLMEVELQRVF